MGPSPRLGMGEGRERSLWPHSRQHMSSSWLCKREEQDSRRSGCMFIFTEMIIGTVPNLPGPQAQRGGSRKVTETVMVTSQGEP